MSTMAKRQRSYLFEMPYQVGAPILTDQASGIDRVLLRSKPEQPISTTTLFDTTDERLSLAGVVLAHRVAERQGEWLLRAPDWQPWLPQEYAEPLDSGDELPGEIATLLASFRRRAELGPVASVVVERACYVLLDRDGTELGEVCDDRVTTRRGGLVVARHRDVTFTPGGAMSALQRNVVIERLNEAGAIKVASFGEPIDRLTSLTHPVMPLALSEPDHVSAEDYLTWLFTDRLHALLRSDLRVRKHEVPDTALLTEELTSVAETVRGLGCLIDPAWAKEFIWNVEKVVAQPVRKDPSELGEAYFEALDLLAVAARSPRMRPVADEWPVEVTESGSARLLLRAGVHRQLDKVLIAIDALDEDSDDQHWADAQASTAALVRILEAGEPVLGKVKGALRKTGKLLAALSVTLNQQRVADASAVSAMTSAEAYQAGREYQEALEQVRLPREAFLGSWPKTRAQLVDEWPNLPADEPADLPQLTPASSAEQCRDE